LVLSSYGYSSKPTIRQYECDVVITIFDDTIEGKPFTQVGFDSVTKPLQFCDIETRKIKRKATMTKNELLRNRSDICLRNQLKYNMF